MNNVQLIITAGLLVLFLLVNQLAGGNDTCAQCYGGLPWYGWGSGFGVLFLAGLVFARRRGERAHNLLKQPAPPVAPAAPETNERWNEELRRKYDSDGPRFPHPVIIAERCIGCHACVESCPHDVLTISYTENHQPVASVVDPDLCLEDTSCEGACPVNPKACLVINTQKQIKSPPTPRRNGLTYESEKVRGCYIIGDVSGAPLIKNAANEGATVMVHLANELHDTGGRGAQAPSDYEVAIIGAGPAGLSAAVMAKRLGLSYVCIEQDTMMSTISRYSKGKYVFFKPQTTMWTGAIHLPGLEEYVEEVLEEVLEEPQRSRVAEMLAEERAVARRLEAKREEAKRTGAKLVLGIEDELAPEIAKTLDAARKRYQELLDQEVNKKLPPAAVERLKRARGRFAALLEGEDKYLLGQFLAGKRAGQEMDARHKARLALAERQYGDQLEATIEAGKLTAERFAALADARCKVAGDKREVLINTWSLNRQDNCVKINDKESCKKVEPAKDGDYFIIETRKEARQAAKTGEATGGVVEATDSIVEAQGGVVEDAGGVEVKDGGIEARDGDGEAKGDGAIVNEYRARRVVFAIGNSSSPTKLKVGDKEIDIKVEHGGVEKEKVQYRLSDPKAFARLKLIVVGGGNSAVEAAVDLVASRNDNGIEFRPAGEQNEVTMLLRSADFKTDVKFGNKQQLYQCIDRGLITLRRNTEIKKVCGRLVVTTNTVNGKDDPPLENDFIFALIGSQRKPALLTRMGIDFIE
jgi:thioredoxin reductase